MFGISAKSFGVLKISAISLVLHTREITDIFNTFDEIYLVFTSENRYPLFLITINRRKAACIKCRCKRTLFYNECELKCCSYSYGTPEGTFLFQYLSEKKSKQKELERKLKQ